MLPGGPANAVGAEEAAPRCRRGGLSVAPVRRVLADSFFGHGFSVTVVRKLELQAEVLAPQHLDALLQVVFVLASNSHDRFVNRSLDLELLVFDGLGDRAPFFDGDALF